jgi:hypothetical protein
MTIRNENGDRFISLKWFSAILITILLSVMGAWAAQRHSFEAEATKRLNLLEWNQSRVMTLLEANRETLLEISRDMKDHRSTGK